jgi:hypothetical protein
MASLAVIATDVLRWERPPDAATAISAEAMTSSLGASVIERTSYSPNVKYRASSLAPAFSMRSATAFSRSSGLGDPDGQDARTFHAAELNAVFACWGGSGDNEQRGHHAHRN